MLGQAYSRQLRFTPEPKQGVRSLGLLPSIMFVNTLVIVFVNTLMSCESGKTINYTNKQQWEAIQLVSLVFPLALSLCCGGTPHRGFLASLLELLSWHCYFWGD